MKLSTLFLPFIPLAVYLSVFSRAVAEVRRADPQHAANAGVLMLPVFLLVAALSTVILLWFGEAVAGAIH